MYYIVDKYSTNITLDKYNDLIEKYNLKYVDQYKKYTIQNPKNKSPTSKHSSIDSES